MKIGFIGLGIMGESMSENIVKKHNDTVYVFDFVKEKTELLASKGAVACSDSVELARNSDVIISMVPKSEHSRSVYMGILDVLDSTKRLAPVSSTHRLSNPNPPPLQVSWESMWAETGRHTRPCVPSSFTWGRM